MIEKWLYHVIMLLSISWVSWISRVGCLFWGWGSRHPIFGCWIGRICWRIWCGLMRLGWGFCGRWESLIVYVCSRKIACFVVVKCFTLNSSLFLGLLKGQYFHFLCCLDEEQQNAFDPSFFSKVMGLNEIHW